MRNRSETHSSRWLPAAAALVALALLVGAPAWADTAPAADRGWGQDDYEADKRRYEARVQYYELEYEKLSLHRQQLDAELNLVWANWSAEARDTYVEEFDRSSEGIQRLGRIEDLKQQENDAYGLFYDYQTVCVRCDERKPDVRERAFNKHLDLLRTRNAHRAAYNQYLDSRQLHIKASVRAAFDEWMADNMDDYMYVLENTIGKLWDDVYSACIEGVFVKVLSDAASLRFTGKPMESPGRLLISCVEDVGLGAFANALLFALQKQFIDDIVGRGIHREVAEYWMFEILAPAGAGKLRGSGKVAQASVKALAREIRDQFRYQIGEGIKKGLRYRFLDNPWAPGAKPTQDVGLRKVREEAIDKLAAEKKDEALKRLQVRFDAYKAGKLMQKYVERVLPVIAAYYDFADLERLEIPKYWDIRRCLEARGKRPLGAEIVAILKRGPKEFQKFTRECRELAQAACPGNIEKAKAVLAEVEATGKNLQAEAGAGRYQALKDDVAALDEALATLSDSLNRAVRDTAALCVSLRDDQQTLRDLLVRVRDDARKTAPLRDRATAHAAAACAADDASAAEREAGQAKDAAGEAGRIGDALTALVSGLEGEVGKGADAIDFADAEAESRQLKQALEALRTGVAEAEGRRDAALGRLGQAERPIEQCTAKDDRAVRGGLAKQRDALTAMTFIDPDKVAELASLRDNAETWIEEMKLRRDQAAACLESVRDVAELVREIRSWADTAEIFVEATLVQAGRAGQCSERLRQAQKDLAPRLRDAVKAAERLEALAADTERQAGEAVALCRAGETELAAARAEVVQLAADARGLRAKGERWQGLAEQVAAVAAGVTPLGKTAAKAARQVGDDRKQAEKHALKACEEMERIRAATSDEQRRERLGRVRAALGDAEASLVSAGNNNRSARDAAGQAAAAAEALPPQADDPSELSARAEAIRDRHQALGRKVKEVAGNGKEAAKLSDRVGKAPAPAAELEAEAEARLQPVAEVPAAANLLARVRAASGRVDAAAGRPGDCAGRLQAAAEAAQQEVAALKDDARDAGKAASSKLDRRLAEIEDGVAGARAAADSAEVFHEAAGSVVAQARQCLALAGDLIAQAERRRATDMAAARRDCPRRIPGSEARWDDDANAPVCECPADTVWTKDKSQCVNEGEFARWADAQCPREFPNSVLEDADARAGQYRCTCPSGYLWNRDNSACVDEAAFVAKARGLCARNYPDSELVEYDARTGDYSCNCLDGWVWKGDRSGCINVADFNRRAAAACARDTANATLRQSDPASGGYDCRCRDGFAWDGQRCIDANLVVQAAQRDCSRQYPGSVVVNVTSVNPLQAECNCPGGTAWNANASGCVAVRGPSPQDIQQSIQGIQTIIDAITRGGGGGGGGRSGGRCHRRADGTLHCGSG